jgi:hypothetical protein
MPSGCVSDRHARSNSASVPGLSWRVVIQTKCSSTMASSPDRRGHQALGTSAGGNPVRELFLPQLGR